jgi:hypothetical protein
MILVWNEGTVPSIPEERPRGVQAKRGKEKIQSDSRERENARIQLL